MQKERIAHLHNMKATILFLLLPLFGIAQFKATRKSFTDSTGNYILEYVYDFDSGIFVAGHGNKPHFTAEIAVYKVGVVMDKCWCGKSWNDTTRLGVLKGLYVPGGCVEDSLAGWVRQVGR